MPIHEDYGYEPPSLEPFYEGLFLLNNTIYARTGCFYKEERIVTNNDLRASIEMLSFSLEHTQEALNKETEIRPLVDLAFANIALAFGLQGAFNPDGSTKTSKKFLDDGLAKLEKAGLIPMVSNRIKPLLDENKDMWPQEILPFIRSFMNVSNRPLRLHRTKVFEQ